MTGPTVDELADALAALVDDADCVYDHHGNCGTHDWWNYCGEAECPHAWGRRLLADRARARRAAQAVTT